MKNKYGVLILHNKNKPAIVIFAKKKTLFQKLESFFRV